MKSFIDFNDCIKKGIKILVILFLTVIFLITNQQTGFTQNFPTKPINLLVPTGPGGPVDLTARLLAEIAKDYFGQPVIAINKGGGGGILPAAIVAKEKPDGYNLAILPQSAFVQIPQMREVAYDPMKDFEFIIKYMVFGGGIICRGDKPWKSMKDVVDYSKKYPGEVTFGAVGIGSATHIAGELIALKEGVKWRVVPFDGGVKMNTALLGGHVDLAVTELLSVRGLIKAGEVRVLAMDDVMEKAEEFAGTTKFEELGYESPSGGTFGIAAPKGTPSSITKMLHDSFKKAIDDPRYAEGCKKLGVIKAYNSGEEFFRILKREYEVRGKIIRHLGLEKK